MHTKKSSTQLTLISIAFAAAILVSSYFLAETGYADVVMFCLIALWWVPFSTLSAADGGTSIGSELRCIKRRFLGS